MPRHVRGRAGPWPWVGSVVLHGVFIALLAAAALRWHSEPPAPQLAIEGEVVRYDDLPPSVKAGKPLRETPRPPEPERQVRPEPEPPKPEPVDDTAQRQAAETQRLEQERIALERREAEEQRAAEQHRIAEQQRARDEEAQRLKAAEDKKRAAAEAEAQRQAEEQKQQEALVARQKQAEQEKAARDTKLRAEREAELQRALASEEEGEAVARSGIVAEYVAMLQQTVERNWIRPPSARPGLECTLYVTQATGGTVIDVKIGECNGDEAVRESVANAVYRSSPLPAPRDPRAFERRLVMVFKPKE
jgi:colicin import membrane protein